MFILCCLLYFRSITNHGNAEQLIRFKKHFKDEIEQDKLGSGPTRVSLDSVKGRVSDPGNFFTDPDPDPTENENPGSWPNLDKNSKFRIFLAFFGKKNFGDFHCLSKNALNRYSNS